MGLELPALPAGPAKPLLGRMSCHQGALFACHPPRPPPLLAQPSPKLHPSFREIPALMHVCLGESCVFIHTTSTSYHTHPPYLGPMSLHIPHGLCAQGLSQPVCTVRHGGTHLRLRHITQHVHIPHIDEHTGSPFYQGHMRGDSPANPWDLLSQNNGKPQADSCRLREPTPCVGPALPPSSSTPQPSPSILLPPAHTLT